MTASQSGDGWPGGSGAIVRPRYRRWSHVVDRIASIDKFRVPIGNQEIELQEVEYEAGGMAMMRIRIRERTRFTIFDIDPVTAERWAKGMLEWSRRSLKG
jgi:hypothetical protein